MKKISNTFITFVTYIFVGALILWQLTALKLVPNEPTFIFLFECAWLGFTILNIFPWDIYKIGKDIQTVAALAVLERVKHKEGRLEYGDKLVKNSYRLALITHITGAVGFYFLGVHTILGTTAFVLAGFSVFAVLVRPFFYRRNTLLAKADWVRTEIDFPKRGITVLRKNLNALRKDLDRLSDSVSKEINQVKTYVDHTVTQTATQTATKTSKDKK